MHEYAPKRGIRPAADIFIHLLPFTQMTEYRRGKVPIEAVKGLKFGKLGLNIDMLTLETAGKDANKK